MKIWVVSSRIRGPRREMRVPTSSHGLTPISVLLQLSRTVLGGTEVIPPAQLRRKAQNIQIARREDRQAVRRDRTEAASRGRKGYGSHDSADVRGRDSRDPPRGTARADDQQPAESMVPVAGIVDILDSYAFVRTSGCLPGVCMCQWDRSKYRPARGDAVRGFIRLPGAKAKSRTSARSLYRWSTDSISGMTVKRLPPPAVSKLAPLYLQERLKMETAQFKLPGALWIFSRRSAKKASAASYPL